MLPQFLQNVLSDTLLTFDPNGTILNANAAALALLGWSEDELVGRPITTLLADDEGDLFEKTVKLDVSKGTGTVAVPLSWISARRKDGTPFLAEWTVLEVSLAQKHGFIAILRRLPETSDSELKLREALAQTEAANRAKSDFLAAMSHELRTPLNAIIGFSEMIHAQLLGPAGVPKYVEYAGDILASASHLLDIITDILEMARMEAGQTEFKPAPLDISSVIEGSMRLLHQRISHSGLVLSTKIAPKLPKIMGDERRLKQVMINLLGNAIKFTPRGGQIVVEAKTVLDGRLMLRVIDSGIGIAEKDIPRALAPFTQVDSVASRRYQGSGLGLPLAKSLVELHGGNLELSSILGKGTTVTLHFSTLNPTEI
ncbi:MAG: PAS domain S-box protein [Alphaproteobacteria bacterium]|nr:PAS domain S-box protein [Alphaproteobacteria bacterium]